MLSGEAILIPNGGRLVIDYARSLLDLAAPLAAGSHRDSVAYTVEDGALVVELAGGKSQPLSQSAQFAGYRGDADEPSAILISNHGLHVEIVIDHSGPIGCDDAAEIDDVLLGIGGHDDHGLRIPSPPWMVRTSPGLPELARPHEARSHRRFRERREDGRVPAQRRPSLYRT